VVVVGVATIRPTGVPTQHPTRELPGVLSPEGGVPAPRWV
jgi:hypothetical protein